MDENNVMNNQNTAIQTLPNPNGNGYYQVRDYGPAQPYYDGNDTSGDLAKGGIIGFVLGSVAIGGFMGIRALMKKFKQPPMYDPRFMQNQGQPYPQNGYDQQQGQPIPPNGGMFNRYDQMRQQAMTPPPQNQYYQQPAPQQAPTQAAPEQK